MRTASQIWVTEESISMIYESLTSGAGVGLLNLPPKPVQDKSAALKGIIQLARNKEVIYFNDWKNNPGPLPLPQTPFHEAERCARILLNHAPPRHLEAVVDQMNTSPEAETPA